MLTFLRCFNLFEINGNIDEDDMVPSIDSPTKEIRIIRKAKRIHRQNSGEGKAENGTPVPNNNKSLILNLKNSRKSREMEGTMSSSSIFPLISSFSIPTSPFWRKLSTEITPFEVMSTL
jgi:hypothetical protein